MEISFSNLVSTALAVVLLASPFLIGLTTSQSEYDPWRDLNGDGTIDLFDCVLLAQVVGTSGAPINTTALLLELEARLDLLNATVMSILENQTFGSLNIVSDSFAGTTDGGDGTIVVSFPIDSFEQAPEIIYCRVVLKEAAVGMPKGALVYANILSIAKDNFEVEVVEHGESSTTVDGVDVDVVYLAIETLERQSAKRVVAGQVTGQPPNLDNIVMPVSIPGANSTNTIVVASGFKTEGSVTTPLAIRGTVQSHNTISFQV